MEFNGQTEIPLARQKVWDALNDIAVLKECIPGCEQLDWVGDHELEAAITTKIGPVKAKFKGSITLEDLNEPKSYTLFGQGKGGAAGFAKGKAHVSLEELGDDMTTLTFEIDASVGGKLAQIGARLIKGSTQKLADQFFEKFKDVAIEKHG